MLNSSISDYFPEYIGGGDFAMALAFFEYYFLNAASSTTGAHVRFINALNANDVSESIDAILELLARRSAGEVQATSNLSTYLQRLRDGGPSRLVKQMDWQKRIDKTMGSVRVNW